MTKSPAIAAEPSRLRSPGGSGGEDPLIHYLDLSASQANEALLGEIFQQARERRVSFARTIACRPSTAR